MPPLRRWLVPVTAALVASSGLWAQGLFLVPSTFRPEVGERFVLGFHTGNSFPESQSPPELNRLQRLSYWTGGLEYNLLGLRRDGPRATATGVVRRWGPVVVGAALLRQSLEIDADEFEFNLRELGLDFVIADRRRLGEAGQPGTELRHHFAKAILRSGNSKDLGGISRPVGHLLELLPGETYAGLTQFQVLFSGQPAEGVAVLVTRQGEPEKLLGLSNPRGLVRVNLTSPGLYRLRAVRYARRQGVRTGEPVWESWHTTLTLQQDPEDPAPAP